MKLPVKFATIQVKQELPNLARHLHILVLGEQVHVSEAVNSDQGQAGFSSSSSG